MFHKKFIDPQSIAIVGASNNLHNPGGTVLRNLLETNFPEKLYAVNPKETEVQGVKCYGNISEIPETDLAIIAIAAKYCLETVKVLCEEKNTRGFIIFSAGFSEKNEEGAALEKSLVTLIESFGGTLLGPNNIGLINQNYAGVFTSPIPKLNKNGVDFISGSGATAVFIIEMAMQQGLAFNSVFSVGNSAQVGVEEVLEYLDESFDETESSRIKLLYIESINHPQKLLKHAQSLIAKGCKIAAIKAGSSEEGSRAASSHTGAMANSDMAVNVLFEKAGIIRCYGRNELVNLASVLTYNPPQGKNVAIVTHAGGPAVMLTDVLSKNNLKIPKLHSDNLLEALYNGSTVENPIDFLATGTAEQLDVILDYCENKFDEIDAVAVIFGSPGLGDVFAVYEVLDKRIKKSKKPIFPILPSVVNVEDEMNAFVAKGHAIFTDEVLFGAALAKVVNQEIYSNNILESRKKKTTFEFPKEKGFQKPEMIQNFLQDYEIPLVKEKYMFSEDDISLTAFDLNFPVVAKVVGPLHKSDVGGVILNIASKQELGASYCKLMKIEGAKYVLVQEMIDGMELFIGVKKEGDFGHLILFGVGGIFLETIQDVQTCLAPVSKEEVENKIKELKFYPVLQGARGKAGINIEQFVDVVLKISNLVTDFPQIEELDLNPLKATEDRVTVVDSRLRIG